MGNRNVLGLAFATDGRLWGAEMGPRGGDELNRIERGSITLPIVSDGIIMTAAPSPTMRHARNSTQRDRLTRSSEIQPDLYSGSAFPAWRGNG